MSFIPSTATSTATRASTCAGSRVCPERSRTVLLGLSDNDDFPPSSGCVASGTSHRLAPTTDEFERLVAEMSRNVTRRFSPYLILGMSAIEIAEGAAGWGRQTSSIGQAL